MKHLKIAAISVLLIGGSVAAFAQATYTENLSYQGKQFGISTNDSWAFSGKTPGPTLSAPAALTNNCALNEIVAAVNQIRSNAVARGLMK